MQQILSFFQEHSGTFNIIFSLIIIFQLFDRRSKGRWLENSLGALRDMSKRLPQSSGKSGIEQKSADLISVINAAILTLNGGRNIFFKFIAEIFKEKKK
ncbi:MAG: hypothetical protein V1901_01535 [Patescibacteria group bacterium]